MEDWAWKILSVAVLVFQGLFAWFMWSLHRKFVTCESCQSLRTDYDKRLGCVAAEGKELRGYLSNLATAKDLHELAREVDGVRGGQEALRESVKSLGVSVDRLEKPLNLLLEYQINKGDRT
ncbi:DUF2730 family protein [Solidesulfovibrio sp.]